MSDRAYARRSDPETSHAAAASVRDLRASQAAVYALFGRPFCHQMSDDLLIVQYPFWQADAGWPQQSESGLRTRRQELAALGLLEVVGESRTPSGRRCRVWARTPVQERLFDV